MAIDIFDLLVDILKISHTNVSEYASQGPLYQFFYLIFFPTLFIIVFIWILSHAIIGSHRGLRILISIGVYAFIILQGYYNWFVILSKFWLFGLIILGFLYVIVYRGGSKGDGGGARGKTLGGIADSLNLSLGKFFDQINPFGKVQQEVEMIKANIEFIYRCISSGDKGRHVEEVINRVHKDLDALAEMLPGKRQNPLYKKLFENLKRAMRGEAPIW